MLIFQKKKKNTGNWKVLLVLKVQERINSWHGNHSSSEGMALISSVATTLPTSSFSSPSLEVEPRGTFSFCLNF